MQEFNIAYGNIQIKSDKKDNILQFIDILQKYNKCIVLTSQPIRKKITDSNGNLIYTFFCECKYKNNIPFALSTINCKKVNCNTLAKITSDLNLRIRFYAETTVNNLHQIYEISQGIFVNSHEYLTEDQLQERYKKTDNNIFLEGF